MTNHISGPWRSVFCTACALETHTPFGIFSEDGVPICELLSGAAAEANAHLIAAAPDLLEACVAFIEATECLCCGGFPWCLHDRDRPHHLSDAIKAAIAKAEGGGG
jgi:hypothetical protein